MEIKLRHFTDLTTDKSKWRSFRDATNYNASPEAKIILTIFRTAGIINTNPEVIRRLAEQKNIHQSLNCWSWTVKIELLGSQYGYVVHGVAMILEAFLISNFCRPCKQVGICLCCELSGRYKVQKWLSEYCFCNWCTIQIITLSPSVQE